MASGGLEPLATGANRVNPFESSTFDGTLKAAVGYLDPSGAYEIRAEDATLSAEATLHVLRMVQECVTNAIRHGRASQIGYRIFFSDSSDSADLCIEISDNGCGPESASPSTRGSGTGLDNLRTRAAALGGRFDLARAAARTIATITLPAATCRPVQAT